ncbi:hypothetical protein Ssi03_05720 [Sphaerisporangium siamense]|uniref:Peptidase M64 n=1 Tax=Sphaerisporangium siamense TaxID=795645 RepID=A0A7W7DEB5_9ACTN|nr:M64 family metallopeptidase [Sphaerisporangium siamense]MBB4704106.1 hypothetical protein [Sphaerisporangium siamense]GII82582.1 hypothetical protein Ssi03_05720 [Sphaerisporangium siamense]
MPGRFTRLAAVALTAAALLSPTLPAAPAHAGPVAEKEWREVFSPDGTISRVLVPARKPAALSRELVQKAAAAEVIPLQETGPSAQRFDLVIIGDGYTAAQMGLLRQHAESKWAEVAAVEPFKKYKNSFNVWLVNVVSNQSGVDNDPYGTTRDTALDMTFYCAGTARLLCLDTAKAQAYAAAAPQVDVILALGNSTTYGGAGYSGISTASGGNAQSGQIAIHEFGHSIGGLADEYYTAGTTYPGGEPGEPNVTTSASGAKWASYIGRATPDGGVIGAYQGGSQYEYGIYRPSENSLMRVLGRPFNLVGLDVMDRAIAAKAGGTPPGPCDALGQRRTGTLASGATAYQPDGNWYYTGASGTHRGCLDGPDAANFDLYLEKWSGSAWGTVATAATIGGDETLTYSGTAGYYRYRIVAGSGSGPYTLGYDVP